MPAVTQLQSTDRNTRATATASTHAANGLRAGVLAAMPAHGPGLKSTQATCRGVISSCPLRLQPPPSPPLGAREEIQLPRRPRVAAALPRGPSLPWRAATSVSSKAGGGAFLISIRITSQVARRASGVCQWSLSNGIRHVKMDKTMRYAKQELLLRSLLRHDIQAEHGGDARVELDGEVVSARHLDGKG